MLAIRFNRIGKNKKAAYRIAVQEHTVAPGGRHVEMLGSYDPHSKKAVLKVERIKYWIEKGAQVSDSAYNLFIREKAIEGTKRTKKIKKPEAPVVAEAPAEVATEAAAEKVVAAEEKPVAEEAPAEAASAPVAEVK